jgi:hypothetical protein
VPLKKMMMMRNGNRFYSGGDFYDRWWCTKKVERSCIFFEPTSVLQMQSRICQSWIRTCCFSFWDFASILRVPWISRSVPVRETAARQQQKPEPFWCQSSIRASIQRQKRQASSIPVRSRCISYATWYYCDTRFKPTSVDAKDDCIDRSRSK